MIKRLSLLGGLAIFAVVLNHTVQWSLISLFNWADRIQASGSAPLDALGGTTYYSLLVVERLAGFSVPAFLFVSGFFVAYAARGRSGTFSWKSAQTRLIALVIPYLIWACVIYVIDALNGAVLSPLKYGLRLVYGGVTPAYFFVPLLCQLYLLSPLVAGWARHHEKWLLAISGGLQLLVIGLIYLGLSVKLSLLNWTLSVLSHWSFFFMWGFYFAAGVVAGYQLEQFKAWLVRLRWWWLAGAIVFGGLMVLEADIVYRVTGANWRDNPFTLPTTLYALSFICCFLAFENVPVPLAKVWHYLSTRTFGIYLIHVIVLERLAWLIYASAPQVIGNPVIFQAILIGGTLGIPVLLMEGVARSPARRFYRQVFG